MVEKNTKSPKVTHKQSKRVNINPFVLIEIFQYFPFNLLYKFSYRCKNKFIHENIMLKFHTINK